MTKTIVINKAQATTNKKDEVQDTTINICGQFPQFDNLKEAAEFHDKNAEKLVETLYRVLPGGTFDRVVVRMLQKKLGHFVVSWGDLDEN